MADHTGIRYARTTTSTYNFDQQTNLISFDPTVCVYHDLDRMFDLAEEFISLTPDEPKLFYLWGHAYEFDVRNDWARFEEFCKLISGRADIFYGTNKEVLL